MDKRTQDKIHCLGYDKPGLPPEILEVADSDEIPVPCRGTSKLPPRDMLASLETQ